jgi:uncharacterized protein YlxW (UPF0749 family)
MILTEQLLLGFITSIIGALGSYILIVEKRHRKERKEMREDHEKERKEMLELHKRQFEQLSEISDESNKVSREHINILSGLKTLLENRRH